MEEERDEKKKTRRKGLKDKIKEREAKERDRSKTPPPVEVEEVRRQPAQASAASGAQKLGGKSGAGDAVAGLTPEMRARLERERRARAAEARLKTLGGG